MAVADTLGPSLEAEFQSRLLAAVNEVGGHTRLGLNTIREDIRSIGGIQAAKKCLRVRHKLDNLSMRPSDYFLASRRTGRMDLSAEAIALEPIWRGLFSREEVDQAMDTLSEYGFAPGLEDRTARAARAQTPVEREPSLGRIRLGDLRRAPSWEDIDVATAKSCECEVTAKTANALRNRLHPPANPSVRGHLAECAKCRGLYPDLAAAFERFDQSALSALSELLTCFEAIMKLEDEHLERFMITGPDDYEGREQYEFDLEAQLREGIRPICAWRAVRLGCQIGRFMSAFTRTFGEPSSGWVKWRRGNVRGPVSDSVRRIGRDQFLLALLALNLLRVRWWEAESEGVLWMPADEGFTSVRGVVQVDPSDDLNEWEELLGKPPQDLHLEGILYLAYCGAVGQLAETESPSSGAAVRQESQEQIDRMEEMLRTIQSSQDQALEAQDAIIGQLERMVLYMRAPTATPARNR